MLVATSVAKERPPSWLEARQRYAQTGDTSLAALCDCEEAQWLCDNVGNMPEGDMRTLYYKAVRGLHSQGASWHMLARSSEMGYMPATGALARRMFGDNERRVQLATLAAEAGEVDGHMALYFCYLLPNRVRIDHLRKAVLLNDESGRHCLINEEFTIDSNSVQYAQKMIDYWGPRRVYRLCFDIRYDFTDPEGLFLFGQAIFKAGVSIVEKRVCGLRVPQTWWREVCKALSVYHARAEPARNSCIAWVLCAKQLPVHKDIRRLIAQSIWSLRASFPPIESFTCRRSERKKRRK